MGYLTGLPVGLPRRWGGGGVSDRGAKGGPLLGLWILTPKFLPLAPLLPRGVPPPTGGRRDSAGAPTARRSSARRATVPRLWGAAVARVQGRRAFLGSRLHELQLHTLVAGPQPGQQGAGP